MTADQVAELVQVWRDANEKGFEFHILTLGRLAGEHYNVIEQKDLDQAAKDLATAINQRIYVEVVHNDPRMKTDAAIWSNVPWENRIGKFHEVGRANA